MSSYSWGLGQKTNNEAKWLVLFFGLEQAKQLKITKIIVMEDSKKVICKMINAYNKGAVKIRRVYERIRKAPASVQTIYFHILRCNNIKADKLENKGAKLEVGFSEVSGILKHTSYVP